jgi:hypothetical protein
VPIDLENRTTVFGSDEITAYIKSLEFVAVVVRRRRVSCFTVLPRDWLLLHASLIFLARQYRLGAQSKLPLQNMVSIVAYNSATFISVYFKTHRSAAWCFMYDFAASEPNLMS